MKTLTDILPEVYQLSEEDQASLAVHLLARLRGAPLGPGDENLARKDAEIDAGTAELINFDVLSKAAKVATQPSYIANPDVKWEHIDYRRLDFVDSRIESYCSALKTIYLNGDARYFVFEAIDRDAFLSAYHFDHRGFEIQVRSFLRCRAVQESFVIDGDLPYASPDDVTIIPQGGCQFEGFMVDVLLGGGAYEGWSGSVLEARSLAKDCVAGLRSFASQTLWTPFVIVQPWCSFFSDIAWDFTFIVQFPHDTRIAITCATDTD